MAAAVGKESVSRDVRDGIEGSWHSVQSFRRKRSKGMRVLGPCAPAR